MSFGRQASEVSHLKRPRVADLKVAAQRSLQETGEMGGGAKAKLRVDSKIRVHLKTLAF